MIVSSVQYPTKSNCLPKINKFPEKEKDCERNNREKAVEAVEAIEAV
jgi:hypothetical protein